MDNQTKLKNAKEVLIKKLVTIGVVLLLIFIVFKSCSKNESAKTIEGKKLDYTIADEWTMGDLNNKGMSILISKDISTHENIKAIAEELKLDYYTYNELMIFFYTDQKAVEMRRNYNETESMFYDKNFVGIFNKDKNKISITSFPKGFGTEEKQILYQ